MRKVFILNFIIFIFFANVASAQHLSKPFAWESRTKRIFYNIKQIISNGHDLMFLFLGKQQDSDSIYQRPVIKVSALTFNGMQIEKDTVSGLLKRLKLHGPVRLFEVSLIHKGFRAKNIKYEYKLLRYDTAYHYTLSSHIVYRNIPPGKYKLYIQALSPFEEDSTGPISIDVEVISPQIASSFIKILKIFVFIVFTIILALVVAYIRSYRLLKIIKSQRDKLAQNNKELEERIRTIREQSIYIEKLNQRLEENYDELEQTNKILKEKEQILISQTSEIESSMRYAQHIQRLILPAVQDFRKIFKSFFVIYLPQEFVSGDFYWISHVKRFKLVVVGDATGHGVPGALMSILGVSTIKKLINEYHLIEPAEILNRMKTELESFYENKILGECPSLEKEGFALSVVKIDPQKRSLTYSTAGQIIYLVSTKNQNLHELKDSRRDITFAFPSPSYSQHTHEYEIGDMLYMFTDGYPDQLGGKDGKKFKYHRLKSLFIDISNLPTEDQKNVLEKTLNDWMYYAHSSDEYPVFQIDDITILGVRL